MSLLLDCSLEKLIAETFHSLWNPKNKYCNYQVACDRFDSKHRYTVKAQGCLVAIVYANEWKNLLPKWNMLVSFLDWKYICLHCSVKKRTHSNWRSNIACLAVRIHWTDPGSILAVNKFYACTNLVKFIFKSFVSCNLQFQAFYVQKKYGLKICIQGL